MRILFSFMCLLISTRALASEQPAPKPKAPTVAVVAAMGDSFHVVTREESIGTLIPRFHRERVNSGDLNRLILNALDSEVARLSPESDRIYLSYSASRLPDAPPRERAQIFFNTAVAELRKNSERMKWDKLFVVTPAFRKGAYESENMRGELQGMGMFIDPLCESNPRECDFSKISVSGTTALLPDGTNGRVNNYMAPFFFITLWEVDPSSLNVISKQEVFEYQRMVGDNYKLSSVFQASDGSHVAEQMNNLIGKSLGHALRQTDLAGRVEAYLLDTPKANP